MHQVEKKKTEDSVWTVLKPLSFSSTGGATLSKEDDNSIYASGKNPSPDTYVVTADTKLTGITGVRLEVLADPRLPGRGPGRAFNGNFALNEFSLNVSPHGEASAAPVQLQRPAANFSQTGYGGYPIEAAIDGNPKTGWSVDPEEGVSHTAIFELREPVGFTADTTLTFKLAQGVAAGSSGHEIGRFRLSVTTANRPLPQPPPPETQKFVLRAQVPASVRSGTLVVTAEFKHGGQRIYKSDIGSRFSVEGKLAGHPVVCQQVFHNATYGGCWQGWRIPIELSSTPQPVELLIETGLPCLFCAFSPALIRSVLSFVT